MIDISRRLDLDALPYQFYTQFFDTLGRMRQITVHQHFFGNVPHYCNQLRAVADAIEQTFVRETDPELTEADQGEGTRVERFAPPLPDSLTGAAE